MSERRIAEQAAFWLLTLQSEDLTPDQSAELVEWLCESPGHVSASFRICSLQRDLARFSQWRQIAPLHATPSRIMRLDPRRTPRCPLCRRRGPGALPAWTATGTAPLAERCWRQSLPRCAWRDGFSLVPALAGDWTPTNGERRRLTDGSVGSLGPDTEDAVQAAPPKLIEQLKPPAMGAPDGEESRWLVAGIRDAGAGCGPVLGSQRARADVCVTVVEGLVAVSEEPRGWHSINPLRPTLPLLSLAANEQVSIDLAGGVSQVHLVEATTTGSAPGVNQLLFQDQTVADIARRFNLHNRVQIEITDSALAARHISGIFRADDPQSFVAFLQVAADVQVSQRDPTHILLGPRLASNSSPSH